MKIERNMKLLDMNGNWYDATRVTGSRSDGKGYVIEIDENLIKLSGDPDRFIASEVQAVLEA